MSSILIPCPGCGALFPPHDGPTHRYVGASSACWALIQSLRSGSPPAPELLTQSSAPHITSTFRPHKDAGLLERVWGDAYGVQHHGDESPQAIQSVAAHLLDLHAIITGHTTQPGWALGRAVRTRGVFHKLAPPPLGRALTYRHLFPGGGVVTPVTRSQYVVSVYEAWMALHRSTVEQWYERYVVPDQVLAVRPR